MDKREWVFMIDETFYGEIIQVVDANGEDDFKHIAQMPDLDDIPEEFTEIAAIPQLLNVLDSIVPMESWQVYECPLCGSLQHSNNTLSMSDLNHKADCPWYLAMRKLGRLER